MLMALLIAVHTLSAVVWVGGMFFAWMCLRPVAAQQLEPPARLRLWAAVTFVLGFGVYELSYRYKADFTHLPAAIGQDLSDWVDDAVMGKSYLEKPADELKAQAEAGNAFAMYVYALRRTNRPAHAFCCWIAGSTSGGCRACMFWQRHWDCKARRAGSRWRCTSAMVLDFYP